MINVVLLLLKWFFLGLLYIFLVFTLIIVYKDLKSAPEDTAESGTETETPSRLVVLEGPGMKTGETYSINGQTLIGRSAECDIIISDVSVSHQHALVSRSKKGYRLEDLESKNGTFLNNIKITRPASLKPGDLIKIGKTVLEFME